tara:strand:+ start:954 stop:1751 length:798 start_codon:yes stop_codon:yes gene_type:complete
MTDTLTYDPTPADAPELSKDEQESLDVAEKLGEEEAKSYAGKFENAEELEKAYLELQKKLGGDEKEDKAEAEQEEVLPEESEESPEELSPAAELITTASDEYYKNDGKLSDETMAKFTEMSSQDLVNAYMEMQKNAPQQDQSEPKDLSEAEVNTIQNSVGGQQTYNDILQWAVNNLDKKLVEGFDEVVASGNPQAIQIAVTGMKAQYDEANGYEGRMLTGKAAKPSDGFRSQAEVVAAMQDPRYANDPAYRQDVYDKLERSNVAF